MNSDRQIQMHEAEIPISLSLVKQLLKAQFPHLADLPLTMVTSTGTVNAICRLGETHAVRLTRVAHYADSLDKEQQWLPTLAAHLPLDIPKPAAYGQPTADYPHPWAIYHWLEGQPYEDALIEDEQQAALDLANFVLALRQIDTSQAPRAGRAPLKALDEKTVTAIATSAAVIDADAATAVWQEAVQLSPWEGEPVWIHADLLRPNLLVRNGRLSAILDFGSAGIGDPAFDIIPAWAVFNKNGRDTFRHALAVDDQTWQRARAYALHQAALIIPYYPKTNPQFVALAKRTIEQIVTAP